ncbi:unnamed protein product, partial [Pleuronectes platessa]
MLKRKRIQPAEDAISWVLSSRDKPCFIEKYIDSNKGRGVFATQPIEPGAFVLEYRGELLSVEDCRSRHYSEKQSTFLFEFLWQNRIWCIDASKEDGSLGRLVNDNHKSPNCTIKKMTNWKPPAVAVEETQIIQADPSSHGASYTDSANPKMTNWKPPAVAVEETQIIPADPSSHGASYTDSANPKMTNWKPPAVAVEETQIIQADPSSHGASYTDSANPKVCAFKEFILVDYPDTDESDNQHPPQQHFYKNEMLRSTKSILIAKVPDVSVNSSDESTSSPSTPLSKMASERPRKNDCLP